MFKFYFIDKKKNFGFVKSFEFLGISSFNIAFFEDLSEYLMECYIWSIWIYEDVCDSLFEEDLVVFWPLSVFPDFNLFRVKSIVIMNEIVIWFLR